MRREESRHDFAFFAGVIIGAVAGAIATLALAPRADGQAREKLRERVQQVDIDQIRERARAASETVRETATSRASELRERASSGEGAGSLIGTARERATEAVNRSPLPVEVDDKSEVRESIEETVEQAEEAAREKLESAAENAEEAAESTKETLEDAADDAESKAKRATE